ncbi:MAG: alkaline phosphatase family protein [bacterium]|nr:alkaline phosphatase family protein [bacterium]
MNKVILIVCDALRDDAAAQGMGYLEHLVESRKATRFTSIAEMPTMSRPNYEALHTGVGCSVHGVVNNRVVRRSHMPNVFELARTAGKVTAAVAYCWYSELYNRAPFDAVTDRECDDDTLNIQHGRFYFTDDMPDFEVFAAAGMLLRRYLPDYLLIHPMALDYLGELHGAQSEQYRKQVINQDQIIASLIAEAAPAGYTFLVTGDHGISDDRMHGGATDDVRHVPLYIIPPHQQGEGDTGRTVKMLNIAPTVLNLLGLPIPETMRELPLV